MLKALRFFGWPLLAGVLIALLIIQRYPEWVGLPSLDVNLQQAPQTTSVQQGPVSYADAVSIAAPSVVNLYTTKLAFANLAERIAGDAVGDLGYVETGNRGRFV